MKLDLDVLFSKRGRFAELDHLGLGWTEYADQTAVYKATV